MHHPCIALCCAAGALFAAATVTATEPPPLPEGYWTQEQTRPILSRTATLRLAPSLDDLAQGERDAVQLLLEVGGIFQRLYEHSLHPQALSAKAGLEAVLAQPEPPPGIDDLPTLYRLFQGPVAITLDNQRVPFLPVAAESPGRNVYPWQVTRDEIEAFTVREPESAARLLGPRSIVRRATTANLRADLDAIARHPVLDTLHPGLRQRLETHANNATARDFYAVPYAVAYADQMIRAHDLLSRAAAAMADLDPDFSQYLHLRARNLLSNDYEGGDAAWVRGDFGRLNAQIGSYETYDDKLFGTKTFFGLSVLVRDSQRSAALVEALGGLQALQDSLPYDGDRRISDHIPVGVYNVVADFGQARGANTASILPNDASHTRKYGRTILLRYNIMTNPTLFADSRAAYAAAVVAGQEGDLSLEATFQRTLWHEVGHYLGPDSTVDGGDLDTALAEFADLMEELKADLVSLFATRALLASGYLDDAGVRAFHAAGVRRVLQKVKPRRTQPYQTMQLMQMNFFLAHGMLRFDRENTELRIHHDTFHDGVTRMLAEVLRIQAMGQRERAAAFVERYGAWDDSLHGELARRIDAASRFRYRLVSYEALAE